MTQLVRIACAALAAALVAACGSSETNSTSTAGSAVCSGRATGFWASEAGLAEVVTADLAYLASFDACDQFGPVETALAQFLTGADGAGAPALHVLCAEWFAFALNARHGRFACDGVDVLFDFGSARLRLAEVEDAVEAALAGGGGAALTAFLADANAGASVCVCASGATGATGGTGSWGE